MKEKNIEIERVSDHGHALGIYIRDPDGNGIEVSYEMPSSEWGHDANSYRSAAPNAAACPDLGTRKSPGTQGHTHSASARKAAPLWGCDTASPL